MVKFKKEKLQTIKSTNFVTCISINHAAVSKISVYLYEGAVEV